MTHIDTLLFKPTLGSSATFAGSKHSRPQNHKITIVCGCKFCPLPQKNVLGNYYFLWSILKNKCATPAATKNHPAYNPCSKASRFLRCRFGMDRWASSIQKIPPSHHLDTRSHRNISRTTHHWDHRGTVERPLRHMSDRVISCDIREIVFFTSTIWKNENPKNIPSSNNYMKKSTTVCLNYVWAV